MDMSDRENLVRMGYLVCSVVLIVVCGCLAPEGLTVHYLCRGLAASIGLYVVVNILRFIPRLYGK